MDKWVKSCLVVVILLIFSFGIVKLTYSQVKGQAAQDEGVWEIVSSPVTDNLYGVAMPSSGDGWIVGSKGLSASIPDGSIILRWNGTNWNKTNDFPDPYGLKSVAFSSGNDVWAVGGNWQHPSKGMILHWNGTDWSKSTGFPGSLNSVAPISPDNVWVVGPYQSTEAISLFGSVRLHFTGSDWSQDTIFDGVGLMSVAMLSESDGWAVGWNGTILRWNGSNWQPVSSPISVETLMSAAVLSANDAWIVGYSGVILHWDGKEWSQASSPVTENLKSVSIVSTNDVWAVGVKGTILHWDGKDWNSVSSPVTQDLNAITMVSVDEGWAVGNGGTILHFTVPAIPRAFVYLPFVQNNGSKITYGTPKPTVTTVNPNR